MNDKLRDATDEQKIPPIEEIKPGEAVDLCNRVAAALALAPGHDFQNSGAWEMMARVFAKRFDSFAVSETAMPAWQHFDAAYQKACDSSNPQDWQHAAMLAQQVRRDTVSATRRIEDPHAKFAYGTREEPHDKNGELIRHLRRIAEIGEGWGSEGDIQAICGEAAAALSTPSAIGTPVKVPPECHAPGQIIVTMKLGVGEWYCHGCGANQGEPKCRHPKEPQYVHGGSNA